MSELMTLNGLTILAERPPAPTRPPLLLVHGFLGGAWYFAKYQAFFAGLGFPTYAINLRGHHGSRPVPDIGRVRVQEYVEDALEVARALAGPESGSMPIVIGHSMGGLIAQKLAEANAVAAAVLLCPAPPAGIPLIGWQLFWRELKHLPELLFSRPIRGSLADHRALIFNRIPPAAHAALHARLVVGSGRAGRDLLLGVAVDESRVRCPVVVISASADRFVPPWIARRVAQKYGALFREYFDHAHFIPWEPGWEIPAAEIEHWLDRALGFGRYASPGLIELLALAKQRGRRVQLRFHDGLVVRARLISVDFEQPGPTLVYEVRDLGDEQHDAADDAQPRRVVATPLEELHDFRVLN